MSLLFKSIEFAARAHSGQFRKGSRVPYIVHPLRVAEILIQHGLPDQVVIAGILHDTVEDTTVTYGELRAEFGPGVARIVESVSEEKSDPWEFRKEHTVEFMKTAPPEALAISLADKIANIQTVCENLRKKGNEVWDQFNRPREKQEWYYRSLAEVYASRKDDLPDDTMLDRYLRLMEEVFSGIGEEKSPPSPGECR